MDGSTASKSTRLYFHWLTFVAETYTLIYRFLKKQSHVKAAKAVKKAAKGVVILRDDAELDGPQLDEIVSEWEAQRKKSCLVSSTNGSVSRENNDEQSKISKKAVEHKTGATPSSVKTKSLKNRKKSGAASSASESSSEEARPEDNANGIVTQDVQPLRSSPSPSSVDSGLESDAQVSKRTESEKLTKSSLTDLVQREDKARVTKKQRVSEKGAAVATAVEIPGDTDVQTQQHNGKKTPRKTNERFQRVKPQNVEPDLLVDNGYEAKARPMNDYGERAHRDLIVTRGSGFRKEKNKKKRGSYRGGEITLENHSIKFDD
ncbi:SRP40, C-terminal domain-containing protein [Pisolithus marmoratus]|nr:SRP40, C-terminal domain-containing protein [Pisolithus marmoratus]